jgi:hypothetical protein
LVNAAAVLHGVREGILTGVKRYDLETVQACGVEVTTMERADEGKWVRYKDVEALLRGSELVTNSTVTV